MTGGRDVALVDVGMVDLVDTAASLLAVSSPDGHDEKMELPYM